MRRGRPPYERMGHEIPFVDLPEDCKRLVLKLYRGLWGLEKHDASRFARAEAVELEAPARR